jgi:hypothetical protein
MQLWDDAFDRGCHALVVQICDDALAVAQRDAAWKQLLARIAPHVEAFATASPVLRRCKLAQPDDVRAVLVAVLARLRAHGCENLRAYVARQPATGGDDEETALVEDLVRLAASDEPAKEGAAEPEAGRTPFRGWLRSLTRYAVKDHVKQRFGWTTSIRARYVVEPKTGAARAEALLAAVRGIAGVLAADLDERAGALDVEYLPGTTRAERVEAAIAACAYRVTESPDLGRSKRDLCTGAARLDAVTEPGERPAITDAITIGRLLEEIAAHMKTFPEPMAEAVRLWLHDEPYEEIAARLQLGDAERGRALVRAGLARLRERFRGQWPAFLER